MSPRSSPDSHADLILDLFDAVGPKHILKHTVRFAAALRAAGGGGTLVIVAPWLSPRTRELLEVEGISYLDLTGNIRLSVPVPAVHVRWQGADKAPEHLRSAEHTVTLAGPRAGRIVRALVDFPPPLRPSAIATLADVSLPWVSKVLSKLDSQMLVERVGREVVRVDWQGLLRERAGTYDLLRHNPAVGFVAPDGPGGVLERVRRVHGQGLIAITGPWAARRISPLSSGGQLMLYVECGPHTPDEWATRLGMVRVDEGADVLVLRAHDQVVFRETRDVEGVPHVALPQLVLDSLAGPGRMPADGEAVLAWMAENEAVWRRGTPTD
ncbi:hypothetical protein BJP25_07000 [Actinokineospora bangkokensis]|uniref:HTH crp-type domain-containing protein n=1 Tax=Actinokineospora bangkokensis TaxID=1193682 RepID=A0A1Q9LU37_9PSEU|nr:hypothetical protein BJP25_07000 [Actinokineospora bangkokensis]